MRTQCKIRRLRIKQYSLVEMIVVLSIFAFVAYVSMELMTSTKKNIDTLLDRGRVDTLGLSILTEVQSSIHQAAEIYNHVPASSNDAEANLFYANIDWSNIPLRMGSDSDPDLHNRLPDFEGQTDAISVWKNSNVGDAYADRFHENDLLLSLAPQNGPGIPAGERGYAGNVLFVAKHLPPIEVVFSPTDSTFAIAKENSESLFYQQLRQKGNQILLFTNGVGEERMYSVDVIRFEIYYLTEDVNKSNMATKSTSSDSVTRSKSLRLVKAESEPFFVHSKLQTLKTQMNAFYNEDTVNNPDDFDPLMNSIFVTNGIFFETIGSRTQRALITKTIEYTDSSSGPIIRDVDLSASNGFSTSPVSESIGFPSDLTHTFISSGAGSIASDVSVSYNTAWKDGVNKLHFTGLDYVPWFSGQPETISGSDASDYYPSGFEISGAGAGANQRIGIRLNLWLRTRGYTAPTDHYAIAARAQ